MQKYLSASSPASGCQGIRASAVNLPFVACPEHRQNLPNDSLTGVKVERPTGNPANEYLPESAQLDWNLSICR
ncbi:MAG: hypothetical protein ACK50J_23105 [Planctomyces sp.]